MSPEELRPHLEAWRLDPILFMKQVLGVTGVWERMIEMAESVRDNRRTAVKGCHSSSKSYTAAALSWWWLCCFQPAKVICTSPKYETLRDTLWADIKTMHANSRIPLGGDMKPRAMEWDLDEETYMRGITAKQDKPDGDAATSFQGYKSPNLLLIFDEAVAIARGLWTSAVGVQTFPHNRWLALCNPTDPASQMANCWRSGSGWNGIRINAFDTPNLREGKLIHDFLPTAEWVDEQRRDFGEGSPAWEARVLGEFPSDPVGTLIGMGDLQAAFAREPVKAPPGLPYTVRLGVDIARQGDDFTVIYAVAGGEIVDCEWFQIADSVEVAGRILMVAQRNGLTPSLADRISMDCSGGWGWGPYDIMRAEGWHATPVEFGGLPVDEKRYFDRRTELWCALRDWIKSEASLSGLGLRERRFLEGDLPGCLVGPAIKKAKTVAKLERKEDMKKRLGHSPDHGDALALAVCPAKIGLDYGGIVKVGPSGLMDDLRKESYESDRDHPVQVERERHAGLYERKMDGGFYGG